MKLEDCIERIEKKIATINEELGEVRDHQATMRTDIDWIKDSILPRVEKELWAIIFLIVGMGAAVWLLK